MKYFRNFQIFSLDSYSNVTKNCRIKINFIFIFKKKKSNQQPTATSVKIWDTLFLLWSGTRPQVWTAWSTRPALFLWQYVFFLFMFNFKAIVCWKSFCRKDSKYYQLLRTIFRNQGWFLKSFYFKSTFIFRYSRKMTQGFRNNPTIFVD